MHLKYSWKAGTAHWNNPYGTNETGFTALPGGIRFSSGFTDIGIYGYYWYLSDAVAVECEDWYGASAGFYPVPKTPNFGESPSTHYMPVTTGMSIRCVKD